MPENFSCVSILMVYRYSEAFEFHLHKYLIVDSYILLSLTRQFVFVLKYNSCFVMDETSNCHLKLIQRVAKCIEYSMIFFTDCVMIRRKFPHETKRNVPYTRWSWSYEIANYFRRLEFEKLMFLYGKPVVGITRNLVEVYTP